MGNNKMGDEAASDKGRVETEREEEMKPDNRNNLKTQEAQRFSALG